jgi:hypothetical protein
MHASLHKAATKSPKLHVLTYIYTLVYVAKRCMGEYSMIRPIHLKFVLMSVCLFVFRLWHCPFVYWVFDSFLNCVGPFCGSCCVLASICSYCCVSVFFLFLGIHICIRVYVSHNFFILRDTIGTFLRNIWSIQVHSDCYYQCTEKNMSIM